MYSNLLAVYNSCYYGISTLSNSTGTLSYTDFNRVRSPILAKVKEEAIFTEINLFSRDVYVPTALLQASSFLKTYMLTGEKATKFCMSPRNVLRTSYNTRANFTNLLANLMDMGNSEYSHSIYNMIDIFKEDELTFRMFGGTLFLADNTPVLGMTTRINPNELDNLKRLYEAELECSDNTVSDGEPVPVLLGYMERISQEYINRNTVVTINPAIFDITGNTIINYIKKGLMSEMAANYSNNLDIRISTQFPVSIIDLNERVDLFKALERDTDETMLPLVGNNLLSLLF